ncbi:MAG: hypothetical protein GX495_11090 [Chloroflexi bacterium]|jgi:hypothetical protein|nr:hypothetical protein [Chloroflexota bacterium]
MPRKYQSLERPAFDRRLMWEVHPVWRGIGCILLVLLPVMAYAGAVLLVEANIEQRWLPLARELMQTVNLPVIGPVPHLYANLLVTVLLVMFGFALITAIYAIADRLKGPPPYTLLDAPLIRRRRRRK